MSKIYLFFRKVYAGSRALVVLAAMAIYAGCSSHNFSEHPATPRPIPILMYHDLSFSTDAGTAGDVWTVQASNFEKHLQFLKAAGYTTILPQDLADVKRGRANLPSQPLIITFDDGFESVLTIAEPLLKQYGFKAIAYLITDKIADTPEARQKYRATPCLIWPEIRAMQKRGVITFGSHSHTHPKHIGGAMAELTVSRDRFRARIGWRPKSFCYPHGQYNDELIHAARAAGYTTAMICEDEVAVLDEQTNLLALPRISVFGGIQQFNVSLMSSEDAGDGYVGCFVSNKGRPVRVAPRLVGAELPENEAWLPETRLEAAAQAWRWRLPDGVAMEDLRLEIWDRNRVLLLFSAP